MSEEERRRIKELMGEKNVMSYEQKRDLIGYGYGLLISLLIVLTYVYLVVIGRIPAFEFSDLAVAALSGYVGLDRMSKARSMLSGSGNGKNGKT